MKGSVGGSVGGGHMIILNYEVPLSEATGFTSWMYP